ncbi:MAG: hypothetical protein ACOCYO_04115 [Bacteroidota bacterium]
MRKFKSIIVSLLFISASAFAQNNITGTFTELANQQIKLVGFNGFDNYTIDSTQAKKKAGINCHSVPKILAWLIYCQKTIKALS